jgi:septum site-determining protein MinC
VHPIKSSLAIKGVQDGLLISIPEGNWGEVLPELLATIREKTDFFRGARLALEMKERELGAADIGQLRDALAEHEVTLWAILTSSEVTATAAADLGIARELTRLQPSAAEEDIPFETELLGEEAVMVERTLRSGNSIRHPGHVVVMGDVNPGAEIIAGGHVVVWGRLRGTVHAGAAGNDKATVCALDLTPTQLRIAGQIAISPKRRGKPKPEIARIRDGQLIAEPWRE